MFLFFENFKPINLFILIFYLMILLLVNMIVLFLFLKLLGSIVKKISKRRFFKTDDKTVYKTNKENFERQFTVGFFHPFCKNPDLVSHDKHL